MKIKSPLLYEPPGGECVTWTSDLVKMAKPTDNITSGFVLIWNMEFRISQQALVSYRNSNSPNMYFIRNCSSIIANFQGRNRLEFDSVRFTIVQTAISPIWERGPLRFARMRIPWGSEQLHLLSWFCASHHLKRYRNKLRSRTVPTC